MPAKGSSGSGPSVALAARAIEAGLEVILTHCFDGALGQATRDQAGVGDQQSVGAGHGAGEVTQLVERAGAEDRADRRVEVEAGVEHARVSLPAAAALAAGRESRTDCPRAAGPKKSGWWGLGRS